MSAKFSGGKQPRKPYHGPSGGRMPGGRGLGPQRHTPAQKGYSADEFLSWDPNTRRVVSSLMGEGVEVETANGKHYSGVLSGVSAEGGIAVSEAHLVKTDQEPSSGELLEMMLFRNPGDMKFLTFNNLNLEELRAAAASAGACGEKFATDAGIAAAAPANGVPAKKELVPFFGEGDDEAIGDLDDAGASNGWSAQEMFSTNEGRGQKSDFRSDISQYTNVSVRREDTVEFRRREAQAAKLADEIERSPHHNRRAQLENIQTEEERFSSVVREEDASAQAQPRPNVYVPPHMRGQQHAPAPQSQQQSPSPPGATADPPGRQDSGGAVSRQDSGRQPKESPKDSRERTEILKRFQRDFVLKGPSTDKSPPQPQGAQSPGSQPSPEASPPGQGPSPPHPSGGMAEAAQPDVSPKHQLSPTAGAAAAPSSGGEGAGTKSQGASTADLAITPHLKPADKDVVVGVAASIPLNVDAEVFVPKAKRAATPNPAPTPPRPVSIPPQQQGGASAMGPFAGQVPVMMVQQQQQQLAAQFQQAILMQPQQQQQQPPQQQPGRPQIRKKAEVSVSSLGEQGPGGGAPQRGGNGGPPQPTPHILAGQPVIQNHFVSAAAHAAAQYNMHGPPGPTVQYNAGAGRMVVSQPYGGPPTLMQQGQDNQGAAVMVSQPTTLYASGNPMMATSMPPMMAQQQPNPQVMGANQGGAAHHPLMHQYPGAGMPQALHGQPHFAAGQQMAPHPGAQPQQQPVVVTMVSQPQQQQQHQYAPMMMPHGQNPMGQPQHQHQHQMPAHYFYPATYGHPHGPQ